MVGLSVILESNQGDISHKSSQVLSKASLLNRTHNYSFIQTPSFPNLHSCYLCKNNLLPGKDIYMYKGDRGFCSVECRCRQITMDEQESTMNEIHSSNHKTSSFSESGASSSSMAASHNSKSATRNKRREFAY